MFGKLFRKKQEVPIDELGKTLLQNLMRFVNNHVETITQDKDLPFHNIDKDRLFTELIILSFWNLNFLHYPLEVFSSVLMPYKYLKCHKGQELKSCHHCRLFHFIQHFNSPDLMGWCKVCISQRHSQ